MGNIASATTDKYVDDGHDGSDEMMLQDRKGFFTLPGEVRNEIYRHCLSFPGTIAIYREKRGIGGRLPIETDTDNSDSESLYSTIIPFFLVSHRFSLEARTYFYSHNAFGVPDASVWPLYWERLPVVTRFFVDRIGPHNAQALRHLRIPFPLYSGRYTEWYCPSVERRPLLPGISSQCPNLTVLEFEARSSRQFRIQLACCDWPTQKRILAALSEALHDEFPALTEIVMDFYEGDLNYYNHSDPAGPGPVSVSWAAQDGVSVVEQLRRCGWTVNHVEYPKQEAFPSHFLPLPITDKKPEMLLPSERPYPSTWRRRKWRLIRMMGMKVDMKEKQAFNESCWARY